MPIYELMNSEKRLNRFSRNNYIQLVLQKITTYVRPTRPYIATTKTELLPINSHVSTLTQGMHQVECKIVLIGFWNNIIERIFYLNEYSKENVDICKKFYQKFINKYKYSMRNEKNRNHILTFIEENESKYYREIVSNFSLIQILKDNTQIIIASKNSLTASIVFFSLNYMETSVNEINYYELILFNIYYVETEIESIFYLFNQMLSISEKKYLKIIKLPMEIKNNMIFKKFILDQIEKRRLEIKYYSS